MGKIKKIGAILVSVLMFVILMPTEVFAATAQVSVSSSSGKVGSTVKVTCKAVMSGTSIGGADVTLQYEPSELTLVSCSSGASGGSGGVYFSQNATNSGQSTLSFTMNFKILKEGTHSISVTNADVYDWESAQSVATNTSGGTITGKVATVNNNTNNNNNNNTTQNNKDKNNKLSSLQIYPGVLSPSFDENTTSYTVTVPSDITEVTITATPQSSKATVNVSGGKDLKLGPNEAKVVVVAENGASVAYTITIVCGEVEKIQVEGTERTINENFTDEQIPTGFTRTKVRYNEREYEALTNATESLQLLYLQNEENSSFYIYNQEAQEFYNFAQIQIAEGKYIILLPLKDDLKEFSEQEIVSLQVQDKQYDGWKLDDEFSVVYAINQDGQEVLYRYDSVDGVFQRYVRETLTVSDDEKMLFPSQYYMYAIVGLGALSIILLISMIYFIASRKARHEGRKRKAIKRMEKQKVKEEKKRLKEEAELERIREEERIAQEKQRAKEEKQRAKEEKKLAKNNKRNKDE